MKPLEEEEFFSTTEMERIIELASGPMDRPEAGEVRPEGVSLAEIKSIAQEVGIASRVVEEAAALVRGERAPRSRISFGTYQGERRLPRAVSQEQLRFMAQEADAFFDLEGQVRETHGYLEWKSKKAGAFVGLVNEPAGLRVRAILDRRLGFLAGGVASAAPGALVAAYLAVNGTGVGGGLGMLGAVAGSIILAREFVAWRRKRVEAKVDGLLEAVLKSPVLRRVSDNHSGSEGGAA